MSATATTVRVVESASVKRGNAATIVVEVPVGPDAADRLNSRAAQEAALEFATKQYGLTSPGFSVDGGVYAVDKTGAALDFNKEGKLPPPAAFRKDYHVNGWI